MGQIAYWEKEKKFDTSENLRKQYAEISNRILDLKLQKYKTEEQYKEAEKGIIDIFDTEKQNSKKKVEGKKVPEVVLAEYPELNKNKETPQAKKPTKVDVEVKENSKDSEGENNADYNKLPKVKFDKKLFIDTKDYLGKGMTPAISTKAVSKGKIWYSQFDANQMAFDAKKVFGTEPDTAKVQKYLEYEAAIANGYELKMYKSGKYGNIRVLQKKDSNMALTENGAKYLAIPYKNKDLEIKEPYEITATDLAKAVYIRRNAVSIVTTAFIYPTDLDNAFISRVEEKQVWYSPNIYYPLSLCANYDEYVKTFEEAIVLKQHSIICNALKEGKQVPKNVLADYPELNQKEETPQAKRTRAEIMEEALVKKEAKLQEKLNTHFEDVKSANGQPLNDKRGGQRTLDRWEKQRQSIRDLEKDVEKSKERIENEKFKNQAVEAHKEEFPQVILDMIREKTLKQWRKYPNILFVDGVEKARIIYKHKADSKYDKGVYYKYVSQIPTKEQEEKFKEVYSKIYKTLENEKTPYDEFLKTDFKKEFKGFLQKTYDIKVNRFDKNSFTNQIPHKYTKDFTNRKNIYLIVADKELPTEIQFKHQDWGSKKATVLDPRQMFEFMQETPQAKKTTKADVESKNKAKIKAKAKAKARKRRIRILKLKN